MSWGALLPWFSNAVLALGLAGSLYKLLRVERPTARAQVAAGQSRSMLDEVEYWQQLVEPLRAEVAACTLKLAEQTQTFERQITAVRDEARAALAVKERDVQMLETQAARLLLRVASLEDQVKAAVVP